MLLQSSIEPYQIGHHESDALAALSAATERLARVSLAPSASEARLLRRIGVYRAQLERLSRWWVRSCPDVEFARANCVRRLAELSEALGEVQARRRAEIGGELDAARSCVAEARRAARVDHVMAEQFRRDGGLRLVV